MSWLRSAAAAAAAAMLAAGCGGSARSVGPATVSSSPYPPRAATSPAGPPPAGTTRQWIFTHAALQAVITDPGVRRRLAGGQLYEILGPRQQPTPDLPVIPTLRFASEAAMASAVRAGLPPAVGAVLYDAESWSYTPPAEQADPARYYAAAAELAHAHGLRLIAAPGLDLVLSRCGRSCGPRAAAYVRERIAAGAARFADVYEIQAQSLERDPAGYAALIAAVGAQARAAHPQVVLVAGLSTNPPGTPVAAAQLVSAMAATRSTVAGYWLNIPGRGPQCPMCNQPRPDLAIATLGGAG